MVGLELGLGLGLGLGLFFMVSSYRLGLQVTGYWLLVRVRDKISVSVRG